MSPSFWAEGWVLKNGLHNSSITAQKFNMNPGREGGREGREEWRTGRRKRGRKRGREGRGGKG